MAEQITIAGELFSVPLRYQAGDQLTAGEAQALNQTYHEGLRQNFAKRIKALRAASLGALDIPALQMELDEYARSYTLGTRVINGRGKARDPIQAEALAIAKARVLKALKERGIDPKQVETAAVADRAQKYLSTHPEILDLARSRVEEAKAAASADLQDLVADLPVKGA